MTQIVDVQISDNNPKFMVGLRWDPNSQKEGVVGHVKLHDLDLSCAVMGSDLKVIDLITPSNHKRDEYHDQIFHKGDHLSGGSDHEDEEILINFEKLDEEIKHLAFVVSICNDTKFSEIQNGSCVFVDYGSMRTLVSVDFSACETAHYLCGILSKNAEGRWTLKQAEKALSVCDKAHIEEVVQQFA